jgi:alanine-glyoxylate transaminase/serine-glyoxylate transaminase/serine-pyruvate transaminase
VGRILDHGVIVAGGLHPAIRAEYFRVGHMGFAVVSTGILRRTVEAVASALRDGGVVFDEGALQEALATL